MRNSPPPRILSATMGQWFAEELKRLRQQRGLGLREIAALCGLPHMTYAAYELGKAVPPQARRAPLAEALAITPQALDDLVEEDEYEVFLRSRRLSEEGRAAAREFLRRIRQDDRQRRAEEEPKGGDRPSPPKTGEGSADSGVG